MTTDYELLADCIHSGQLTPAQVVEHMKDEVFAAWYRKRYRSQTVPQ